MRPAVTGAILIILTCLAAPVATALPMDQDVFTSFEMITTPLGTPFDLSTFDPSATPDVTFSGDAFSAFLGNALLYHSGFFSWMVDGGGTGVITFEVNSAVVEFYARTNPLVSAGETTVITAFDDLGGVVDSVTITQAEGFVLVSFAGSIDHIDVVNNAVTTGANAYNAIDDFGYTPVALPEPSALALLSLGLLAWVRRRT